MSENRERAARKRETLSGMDLLGEEACFRALQTRDPRFDGRLFVGITSTGIYCRPVCPARTAKREHCRFFASAAAAQEAGFRPCLRCRPETAPDLASWRGSSNTVSRALALIADGVLDDPKATVDQLAARLGLGERQLRRLFQQHLGASPVSVAQTRRILFAKQLLQETRLRMSDVALASGFGSIRRFNETFHDLFHRPPSALRRTADRFTRSPAAAGVTLRVRYKAPYDWDALQSYLRARAIPGVEEVTAASYRRTLAADPGFGTVEVAHEPARRNLVVTVRVSSVRSLPVIVARVRRVFDTGADIETIGAHLARDPFLAPLVAERPGLRAPGGWDGFELAVRAILGQQVTVGAGRALAERLVVACGEILPEDARHGFPALKHSFPSPAQVAASDLRTLGMPAARRAALHSLAEAALADPQLFHPFGTVEDAIVRLRAIRGVGEWTAQYIALRALRETDAFPATDIGLLRGAVGDGGGVRPTPRALLLRAEPWRPWRAYAAQHLWAADAAREKPRERRRHG